MTDRSGRIPLYGWLILPLLVIALLPWWRNHAHLRDFYDYGLVISGVGLLEKGQKPYVDFVTPIQAGFWGLSWLVEKAGGGNYLALTRGAAALIILMMAGCTLVLARRWSGWAAGAVALSVTVMSAAQHTILWHNALGVFCLALVVWAAALAPVWRRADWPWPAIVAVGLFVGGINKMNFHLVGLAVALAWALRAGLNRQAGWGAVLVTGLAWLTAGGLLPVMAELAWTGASLEVWWHNVVELAVGTRAQTLAQIWSWKFLLTPIHDYYGRLFLPQVGLVGAGLSLAALIGCWPARAGQKIWQWDFILLPAASCLAAVAGAALLATNQEIAYLGLGAWLVLVAGLWLGFAPSRRPGFFVGGLVLPALLLAAVAWTSAWQGQRSQFGYSESPRATYQMVDRANPDFAYLERVWLPPETIQTIALFGPWLPEPSAGGPRPVFYAGGLEWLQRLMPGIRQSGQPLWVHWGTTYGPRESLWLMRTLAADNRYQVVLTTLARDDWPREVRAILDQYFVRDLLGPVTARWTRRTAGRTDIPDSIDFLNRAGGNVAAQVLQTHEEPMGLLRFEQDRIMLGVMAGEGRVLVAAPTYRFGADALLERSSLARPGPLHADYKVIVHGASPEEVRWSARIELPAGQQRVAVPFKIDSMGHNLQLRVTVPDAQFGELSAGYRNLQISHAIESTQGAPRLRAGAPPDENLTAEAAESLFGATSWRPQQLVVRGGQPGPQGLDLAAGGEVWMHSEGMAGEIRGQVTCADSGGGRPAVRVVWYKGGRLQMMQQGQIPAGQPFEFHVWCAEPGGWFGLLLDAAPDTLPARVRVREAQVVVP